MQELSPNGGLAQTTIPLNPNVLNSGQPPTQPLVLQCAIRCSVDIFYFNVPYELSVVLMGTEPASKEMFGEAWKRISEARQAVTTVGQAQQIVPPERALEVFRMYRIHHVARREGNDSVHLYFSTCTVNRLAVFCELGLQQSAPGVQLVVCTDAPPLVPLFQALVAELLQVAWGGGGATPAGGH